jgi:hypothetical protein
MNIAFSDLFGKKVALLLWYNNESGDATAGVVSGVAFLHDGHMAIHRGSLLPPMQIPLPLVWRAKQVPNELKDILKMADYCIQGTIREMGLTSKSADDWFWA